VAVRDDIQTFADLALDVRRQTIEDEYQHELSSATTEISSHGLSRNSSAYEVTELRLMGEKLHKLILARTETLIDAYQSHNARIDEAEIIRQIGSFKVQTAGGMASGHQWNAIHAAARTGRQDPTLSAKADSFQRELERKGHAAGNEARLLIKKAVLAKPKEIVMPNQVHNEYHLLGPNPRVTINGNDQSINTVTVQPDELFTKLRAELLAVVPENEERDRILERLVALQEAQGTSAFFRASWKLHGFRGKLDYRDNALPPGARRNGASGHQLITGKRPHNSTHKIPLPDEAPGGGCWWWVAG
jgi:hypothetical protein